MLITNHFANFTQCNSRSCMKNSLKDFPNIPKTSAIRAALLIKMNDLLDNIGDDHKFELIDLPFRNTN